MRKMCSKQALPTDGHHWLPCCRFQKETECFIVLICPMPAGTTTPGWDVWYLITLERTGNYSGMQTANRFPKSSKNKTILTLFTTTVTNHTMAGCGLIQYFGGN